MIHGYENNSSKYKVTPSQAYMNGGKPRGELYGKRGRTCPTCGCIATYYSSSGLRELNITGFCEPCFDYVTTPPDERDADDAWMSLVERTAPTSQPHLTPTESTEEA